MHRAGFPVVARPSLQKWTASALSFLNTQIVRSAVLAAAARDQRSWVQGVRQSPCEGKGVNARRASCTRRMQKDQTEVNCLTSKPLILRVKRLETQRDYIQASMLLL